MSEEEKKAIDFFKNNALVRIENEQIVASGNAYKVVILNYIDRLQKELEQEKENNYSLVLDFKRISKKLGLENPKILAILVELDRLQKENEFLKAPFEYANGNTLDKRYVEMNFVSKYKIKNKIKAIENGKPFWFREEERKGALFILGELLEENKI